MILKISTQYKNWYVSARTMNYLVSNARTVTKYPAPDVILIYGLKWFRD